MSEFYQNSDLEDTFGISSNALDVWSRDLNRKIVARRTDMKSAEVQRVAEMRDVLDSVLSDTVTKPRIPRQPPVGTVLRWEKSFHSGGPMYVYVAVRVGPRWYSTGKEGKCSVFDWDELQEQIADWPCLMVMTYKEIPQLPKDPVDSLDNPEDWFNANFPEETS